MQLLKDWPKRPWSISLRTFEMLHRVGNLLVAHLSERTEFRELFVLFFEQAEDGNGVVAEITAVSISAVIDALGWRRPLLHCRSVSAVLVDWLDGPANVDRQWRSTLARFACALRNRLHLLTSPNSLLRLACNHGRSRFSSLGPLGGGQSSVMEPSLNLRNKIWKSSIYIYISLFCTRSTTQTK